MSAGPAISPVWTAAILVLAVAAGLVRLWLRRRAALADARGPQGRFALLAVLQIVVGTLLFLTLHPPPGGPRGGALTVITRGAAPEAVRAAEPVVIALPEAGAVAGAERVPDLATALRRHPEVARLTVIGEALPPRDRVPPGIPVKSDPSPHPVGFVDIALPRPVSPGTAFSVGGAIGSLPAGVVELADPSGAVVGRAPVRAGQRFIVSSAARTAGLAVFDLRLRDGAGHVVQRLDVPLETRAGPRPLVRVLAGAPSPEVNLLRRWARAAEVDLSARFALGGGVEVGDADGGPLTRDALAKTDLLMVDDRRWETLTVGERAGIGLAVEAGMGLLLRPTASLSGATRREWSLLGAPLSGEGDAQPVSLVEDRDVPDVTRRVLTDNGDQAVSVLRAPNGSPIASWRSRGQGRVAVWTLVDSYVLSLAGRNDLHADLWGTIFSDLARPIDDPRPYGVGLPHVSERVAICGASSGDRVSATGRPDVTLIRDPSAGAEDCAAFWPTVSGWVLVRAGASTEVPIYIHASLPGSLTKAEAADVPATLRSERSVQSARGRPGASWPWFLVCLISLAALWWLERFRSRSLKPRNSWS